MNSFAKIIEMLSLGKSKHRKKGINPKSPWRAVSIEPRNINPCLKVRSIEDIRFLIDKVPDLPLAGCNRTDDCRCHYVQHLDRRSNNIRRDIDLGISRRPHLDPERRIARNERRLAG